ncbi:MAG TPA: cupin domain-containing protein [Roseiflexaceae bacterium]|nr:cupin domain-containing protein [Roseiflexaceae bacterium]
MTSRYHATVADAIAQLPEQTAEQLRFTTLLRHGTLSIELYAPQGYDAQQPHTQDEVYVVIAGQGEFLNGTQRHPFGPGDVIFVPAGVIHRFENFSSDFQTWVIFYGPEGGEQIAS